MLRISKAKAKELYGAAIDEEVVQRLVHDPEYRQSCVQECREEMQELLKLKEQQLDKEIKAKYDQKIEEAVQELESKTRTRLKREAITKLEQLYEASKEEIDRTIEDRMKWVKKPVTFVSPAKKIRTTPQ